MTIRGKSALRKKRFIGLESQSTKGNVTTRLKSASSASHFVHKLVTQNGDVRQVPVPLRKIEAVADHVPVRDLEPDVPDGHLDLAAAVLHEQRADLQRRGVAGAEVPEQVRQREARIDDVLEDQDVAALDVYVEILEDAHDTRGI